MALTPGGRRSPSTPRPTSPGGGDGDGAGPAGGGQPGGAPGPSRLRRRRWPRSAWLGVLRLGLLIGGLVIIVDLLTMLLIQQTTNPDEIAVWAQVDELANYVLFSLLGVLVVRDTGVMLSGAVAGVFASLLDAVVVTAASLMVPPAPSLEELGVGFARNLLIGTVFAGLSGVVYALVQRWSDGQRRRR